MAPNVYRVFEGTCLWKRRKDSWSSLSTPQFLEDLVLPGTIGAPYSSHLHIGLFVYPGFAMIHPHLTSQTIPFLQRSISQLVFPSDAARIASGRQNCSTFDIVLVSGALWLHCSCRLIPGFVVIPISFSISFTFSASQYLTALSVLCFVVARFFLLGANYDSLVCPSCLPWNKDDRASKWPRFSYTYLKRRLKLGRRSYLKCRLLAKSFSRILRKKAWAGETENEGREWVKNKNRGDEAKNEVEVTFQSIYLHIYIHVCFSLKPTAPFPVRQLYLTAVAKRDRNVDHYLILRKSP